MISEKQYKVLKGLPPYGPMYIPVSDENEFYGSEGLVIEFVKSNGDKWVGNFKPGRNTYTKIYDFPQENIVIVIYKGQGYLMNPNNTNPLLIFGNKIGDSILTNDDRLICSGDWNISILEYKTNKIWESETLANGGIKDLKVEGTMLYGFSFDTTDQSFPWYKFSLDLVSKEITGGTYLSSLATIRWLDEVKKKVEKKMKDKKFGNQKPWWKIW